MVSPKALYVIKLHVTAQPGPVILVFNAIAIDMDPPFYGGSV